MNDEAAASFVEAFQAAWDSRRGDAFSHLWHVDGKLFHPVYGDRVLLGRDHPAEQTRTLDAQPDLEYGVEHWAWRDDQLFLQWRSKMTFRGRRVELQGVDLFLVEGGRIREERVFMDTMPIWAALDPSMDRGPLIPRQASAL